MNRSKSTRELGMRFAKEHDTEELDDFRKSVLEINRNGGTKESRDLEEAIDNTIISEGTGDMKKYIERSRQLEESDSLTKMMKVTQPNPVKMFACGSEVVCMLLQTGELYIWCDDDPHPKLMNGYLSPHVSHTNEARIKAGESGHISDDYRVYWTEQELRIRSKSELMALANRLDVQLYSREEMLVRIKEKAEHDHNAVAEHIKGDPTLLPSTELVKAALRLGVIHEPSIERLIRSIIRYRLQETVFVTHVAAGKHHFAACTAESSNNVWTWGLNDKGQLGLGDTITREYPTQVTLPRPIKYTECGDKTTYAVTNDGEVYSWGLGENGQLGHTIKNNDNNINNNNDTNIQSIVAENISIPKRMNVLSAKSMSLRNGKRNIKNKKNGDNGSNSKKTGGDDSKNSNGSSSSFSSTSTEENRSIHNSARDDEHDLLAEHHHAQSHHSNGGLQPGDDDITSLLRGSSSNGKSYLHLAAGGNQAAAWTTKFELLPGVSLEDHSNLEQWKKEAHEKFFRLKALRSTHDELIMLHGFPDACPSHAEMVLCEPSRHELQKENDRRDLASIGKTSYFSEICMMNGDTQIIARNCIKCFGRGFTRDRCLTQLDMFIDNKTQELLIKKKRILKTQSGIRAIMKSVLEQGRDVDRTRSESQRLERELQTLNDEVLAISNTTSDSMISRLNEKILSVTATLDNCSHREMLCKKSLYLLKAQLHRERIELLQHHTAYNTTDTELMLYRRVRIRRQKTLAWNMIAQREAYTRKVIVAAHELWSKVMKADFRHLLADKEEQKKIIQDNFGLANHNYDDLNDYDDGGGEKNEKSGKSGKGEKKRDNIRNPSERLIYELTFKLSTRKLQALMKESIIKMKRFHVSSIRFEGHTVLGDCVNGWMEKDNKGRPKLRVPVSGKDSTNSSVLYCHYFQYGGKECRLPCPFGHVHEKIPEKLRQDALRKQGFKGNDFAPVEPGNETITLNKPLLYVSL
jgi:hypothetical protein